MLVCGRVRPAHRPCHAGVHLCWGGLGRPGAGRRAVRAPPVRMLAAGSVGASLHTPRSIPAPRRVCVRRVCVCVPRAPPVRGRRRGALCRACSAGGGAGGALQEAPCEAGAGAGRPSGCERGGRRSGGRRRRAQALSKLREEAAVLKVREADLSLLKEVVEPARSKFQQARPGAAAPCPYPRPRVAVSLLAGSAYPTLSLGPPQPRSADSRAPA